MWYFFSDLDRIILQSDWNDGRVLCNLVTSVGGNVQGWPTMTGDTVENMQRGMFNHYPTDFR